jgi:hypothetical protein
MFEVAAMRKYRQTYPRTKPAHRPVWERSADVLLAIAIALGIAQLLASWWSA